MTLLGPASSAGKARGAYYTPSAIATFLARWAIRSPHDRVLEPSAGDGAFVVAAADRFRTLVQDDLPVGLVAVERDPAEAAKIRAHVPGAVVVASDFFDITPQSGQQFDAVIGNPPYIRFHGFTGPDRVKALGRARAQGAELSELASSWAHFVAHSIGFLGPMGRLALVLPAELLHADYAHPIRELLSRRFRSVTVVAFDRQVFPDAQVDAVLLLASPEGEPGYRVVRTHDAATLQTVDTAPNDGLGSIRPRGDQPSRWSAAMEPGAAAVYETLAASPSFVRLGSRASVDIGFVSGSDDYFVPTRERADELRLPPEVLVPAVRRPGDVRGLVARPDQAGVLFRPVGMDATRLSTVAAYLEHGRLVGVSGRYKCRVRQDWFIVPLPRAQPDAFMPYMNHRAPRLIVNSAGAWSTNLLHGIRLRDPADDVRALAAAMTASGTLLSAEIEGRSYGGGVLKLETKEAERLLIADPTPNSRAALVAALPTLDILVRDGDLQAAARITDDILGLDHDLLWDAYMAFRSRRLGRRKSRAPAAA